MVGDIDVNFLWVWLKRDCLRDWSSLDAMPKCTSRMCEVKMEPWTSVATAEDCPSLRPPEVASHRFGCFVCGWVILPNGIMVPLPAIYCKTTQLINETEMNFSELDFSRSPLKRQNYFFFPESLCFLSVIDFSPPAFFVFFFWTISLHYTFIMHLFSLRTIKNHFQNFLSHCI